MSESTCREWCVWSAEKCPLLVNVYCHLDHVVLANRGHNFGVRGCWLVHSCKKHLWFCSHAVGLVALQSMMNAKLSQQKIIDIIDSYPIPKWREPSLFGWISFWLGQGLCWLNLEFIIDQRNVHLILSTASHCFFQGHLVSKINPKSSLLSTPAVVAGWNAPPPRWSCWSELMISSVEEGRRRVQSSLCVSHYDDIEVEVFRE